MNISFNSKKFKIKRLCTFIFVLCLLCSSISLTVFAETKYKTIPIAMAAETKYKTIPIAMAAGTKYKTIPIAMAADNNYAYPTLVSMTSALENAGPNTKYDFYLMVPSNFTDENKNIIKSLEKKYKRCSIKIIDMGNAFKEAKSNSRFTTPAYYRLNLSELLPNLDKIIWLDGDTIVFKDLTEMININMNKYYYRGFLDPGWKEMININMNKYYYRGFLDPGWKSIAPDPKTYDHYINSGVMLINLNKLRKDNIYEKFINFINTNHGNYFYDQGVINTVCKDNIYCLPPKFGMWNFQNLESARAANAQLNKKCRYKESDYLDAYKDPSILHYAGSAKPWNNTKVCKASDWWYYAGKTGYLNNIKKKYLLLDGKYMIQSALNENKVLDIRDGSKKNGANLQLWEKNNSPAQMFFVKHHKSDGCYSIKNEGSGKNVDVAGARKANGANIQQYMSNNTDAQKWHLIKEGDFYRLKSKCNGLFMDVDNAKTKNGTNIICWENNGSDAQKFKFLKAA